MQASLRRLGARPYASGRAATPRTSVQSRNGVPQALRTSVPIPGLNVINDDISKTEEDMRNLELRDVRVRGTGNE